MWAWTIAGRADAARADWPPHTIWSGTILASSWRRQGSIISVSSISKQLWPQRNRKASRLRRSRSVSPDFARFMQHQAAEGRRVTAEFALRGAAAWTSWSLDGLLMLLATVDYYFLACRSPYRRVCRSWYRTTRAGPVAAAGHGRWPKRRHCRSWSRLASAEYRLSHCVSGCGPSRLELACRGQAKSTVAEAWLSAAGSSRWCGYWTREVAWMG